MGKVMITDTILRDAHQSQAATRMRTEDMLPACEVLDNAGFYSLECWGGATFDSCLRFLNEDPWVRLRKLREAMPKTKLQMLFRGQNILGYKHYADDVVDEFVRLSIKNGINVIRIKMTAFLLSVALTAYSGCLYAFYMSYVDPTGFGWKKSADWVIMVFFGGVNSLTGSTLGAFILSALPQVLRGLQNYRYVIYAVLVLLIINFKPSGLLGEWEFTPRDIARSARKLKRKLGLKKEEN